MVNNETIYVYIFMALFIIQLLLTVASFVLLIMLLKTQSANDIIKVNEFPLQKESDIQIGIAQQVEEETSNEIVFADAMSIDGLDSFDELEHTESDPDRLLKILEFGLPDEELEEIMKKLGKD